MLLLFTLYNVEMIRSSIIYKKEGEYMNNFEIRKALMEAGMRNYQLADLLGITEFSLSRKLRKEISKDEQTKILKIIREHKDGE